MGYAHFHLKLLKSCNKQSNMLRIYGTRCNGLHYEIDIEKCSMNLDEFIRRKTKDRRELLRMFREIIRGINHIHDTGCTKAKAYGATSIYSQPKHLVTKSEDLMKEPFSRDVYSVGRVILRAFTQHKIKDDDGFNKRCYDSGMMFDSDMQELFCKDPLVHHLVKLCLECRKYKNFSAKNIFDHFCFWEKRRHLEFMQSASDAIQGGNKIIKTQLKSSEADVMGAKGWASPFQTEWFKNRAKLTERIV
ncbi:FMP32, mitochondrial-like protein [Tanacetum coccineum]